MAAPGQRRQGNQPVFHGSRGSNTQDRATSDHRNEALDRCPYRILHRPRVLYRCVLGPSRFAASGPVELQLTGVHRDVRTSR
jgi:hypothetical protein